MAENSTSPVIKLGLPKGRMQNEVFTLMADAGFPVKLDERGYRPSVGRSVAADTHAELLKNVISFEAKIQKPQSIFGMLDAGSRDIGFGGADWKRELGSQAIELLDTGLDPVRIVAAAPTALVHDGRLPTSRTYIVASEYENITKEWIAAHHKGSSFLHSYGATEVFPPEDADVILDNCATGSTLRANGLVIVDEVMKSSTRLYASPRVMDNVHKRAAIESFVLLLKSVLDARSRVMLEVNIAADKLHSLTAALPSLRAPTISQLKDGNSYAVRVSAPRAMLALLIPEIKRLGGTGIVVSDICQLVE